MTSQALIMSSTTGAASVQTLSTLEIKLENLPCMVSGVYSNDSDMQLEATILIRKLLCIGNPPIEEVIQSGVVPLFTEFLLREDITQLQSEAARALNTIVITCENSSLVLFDYVAVPFFVKLLANSSSDDVREQAICWLGNVAGLSLRYRDLVLSQGALIPLLSHLKSEEEHAKLSMLRNATLTLLNFCLGKPHPTLELTKPAVLAAVKRLLVDSNDEEVLTNTCWALSYLSADGNKIQAVIEEGFCQRLVELLQHPSPCVVIPALLTVMNIVTGIINVQTYQVTGSIDPLVNLAQTAEFDIKKEFAWAISKATSGGNNEQIKYLVNRGCTKPLCDLLSCSDPRIVSVCLQGLENILKAGEELEKKNLGADDVNSFAQIIDEAEGLEKIENLQSHDNHEISEKAVKILETYYWLEEKEDEPAAAAHPRFN